MMHLLYFSIYAIGDCIQGPMLAHKAEDEGIEKHYIYNCYVTLFLCRGVGLLKSVVVKMSSNPFDRKPHVYKSTKVKHTAIRSPVIVRQKVHSIISYIAL